MRTQEVLSLLKDSQAYYSSSASHPEKTSQKDKSLWKAKKKKTNTNGKGKHGETFTQLKRLEIHF